MPNLLTGLPTEIVKKINKTKQTRGAQPYERVPYQNRVNRDGIAIVPYAFRDRLHPNFGNGYRLLIRPREYFSAPGIRRDDFDPAVVIGENAFVYYDNRRDWRELPPPADWEPCPDRTGRGCYLARVPATTAADQGEANAIVRGEAQGIRFFEYATTEDTNHSSLQLAFLAWHTVGIDDVRIDAGHGVPEALRTFLQERALADIDRFIQEGAMARLNGGVVTVCPLCLEPLRATGLMTRLEQAEGREVVDLTVTEVNLFHLRDLRPGEYNHRPYQLAWGHHHCNTVARDMGVTRTLEWMRGVLARHEILPAATVQQATAAAPLPEPDREGG